MKASYIEEPYEENGSTRSMDVDVVDMSSERWPGKGEEVFDGIVRGFQLLHEEIAVIEGFRVRLYDVDYEFTGKRSSGRLIDALESQGFDEPKHYHVVYDGSFPPSMVSSIHNARTDDGTMWHDEDITGISGISLSTTFLSFASSYVRGLHQLMHNYINDDIAVKYADSDDGYDAVHQLGTSVSNVRTVMADTYPHRVTDGECAGSFWLRWRAPNKETLSFSECTLNVIEESILENES